MRRKRVLVTCMSLCLAVSMIAMVFAAGQSPAQACKEDPTEIYLWMFDRCLMFVRKISEQMFGTCSLRFREMFLA